jgi:hypothetical protein
MRVLAVPQFLVATIAIETRSGNRSPARAFKYRLIAASYEAVSENAARASSSAGPAVAPLFPFISSSTRSYWPGSVTIVTNLLFLDAAANHARPADIDIFNRLFQRTARLGDRLFKRVEIDAHQVNRLDLMLFHGRGVFGIVAHPSSRRESSDAAS